MQSEELLTFWESLPVDPDAQLRTVREYATRVLGTPLDAAAWLGRTHPAILDGSCVASEACRTRAGFKAAILELARLDRHA